MHSVAPATVHLHTVQGQLVALSALEDAFGRHTYYTVLLTQPWHRNTTAHTYTHKHSTHIHTQTQHTHTHTHTHTQVSSVSLPLTRRHTLVPPRLLHEVDFTIDLTGLGSRSSLKSLVSWSSDSKMALSSDSSSILHQKLYHTKGAPEPLLTVKILCIQSGKLPTMLPYMYRSTI